MNLAKISEMPKWQRMAAVATALFFVLSAVRVITGANDLTSSGTWGTTLRLAVPILLAGLSGLWAERAGIVNIGVEGMMVLGTWAGGFGAWKWGPWVGLALAVIGGMLGGLIHALATVTFNVDHIVSGVAINIMAGGFVRFLSARYFVGQRGGGLSQSPRQRSAIATIDVPFLAGGKLFGWTSPDLLGRLERTRFPVVADMAGIGHGLLSDLSLASILAVALVGFTGAFLWKTRLGLRLRSSGEAPAAAASLGVRVARVRYFALIMSGGFAGLGGGYLSVVASSYYRQDQTGGRGYIGLATMIFGNWRPGGLLGGAGLFGYADALRLRDESSIPALFLFVAIVLGALAGYSLWRRRSATSSGMRPTVVSIVITAVLSLIFLEMWIVIDSVPESITVATAYIVTLVVLATASQRLRPPAWVGRPYRKGEAH